jgi:hypothetical protein
VLKSTFFFTFGGENGTFNDRLILLETYSPRKDGKKLDYEIEAL